MSKSDCPTTIAMSVREMALVEQTVNTVLETTMGNADMVFCVGVALLSACYKVGKAAGAPYSLDEYVCFVREQMSLFDGAFGVISHRRGSD